MIVYYLIDDNELQMISESSNKVKEIALQFAKRIDADDYKAGDKLPSYMEIAKVTGIGRHSTKGVFKLLRQWQYIKCKQGTNAVVLEKSQRQKVPVGDSKTFNLNLNKKPSHKHVVAVEKNYRNFKIEFRENHSPANHIGDYPSLRSTLSLALNRHNGTHYRANQIYYHYNLNTILAILSEIIGVGGGAFAIPKNSLLIKSIVQLPHITVMEFDVDNEGIQIADLKKYCENYDIRAVFIMTRANYPDNVYTSTRRIDELMELQKQYNFMIVDISLYEPVLNPKKSYLLQKAIKAINSVVYLQPVGYIVEEMNEMYFLAGNEDLIQQISERGDIYAGKRCRLKAAATDQTLNSIPYRRACELVRADIISLRKDIHKAFCRNGFWKPEGLGDESSVVLYLEPLNGKFPDNVYDRLDDLNIEVIDAETYWLTGGPVKGIRIDFSAYIGKKNQLLLFIQLNKIFENLVVTQ